MTTSEDSARNEPTDSATTDDQTTSPQRTLLEQLQDQLDVVTSRLDKLAAELTDETSDTRVQLESQMKRIRQRADDTIAQMRDRLHSTGPADGASPGADGSADSDQDANTGETVALVEDLNSAVDTLEADIGASAEQEPEGYRAVVDRQLRTWRARAEQLRNQSSIGGGEAKADLEDAGRRLTDVRINVLAKLSHLANEVASEAQEAAGDFREAARHAMDEVREEVEEALVEVRESVEKVADSVAKRSNRAGSGSEGSADQTATDPGGAGDEAGNNADSDEPRDSATEGPSDN